MHLVLSIKMDHALGVSFFTLPLRGSMTSHLPPRGAFMETCQVFFSRREGYVFLGVYRGL